MMKRDVTLTTASLISVLLVTLHMAGDVVGQMEAGTLSTLAIVSAFTTLWLYAACILPGRTSGYVIIILTSLMGLVIPAVHMTGAGIGPRLARFGGGFSFVWILFALGASSAFTLVLAVRGLWSQRRAATLDGSTT